MLLNIDIMYLKHLSCEKVIKYKSTGKREQSSLCKYTQWVDRGTDVSEVIFHNNRDHDGCHQNKF